MKSFVFLNYLIITLVLIRADYSSAFSTNISGYVKQLNNYSSIATDDFEYSDNEVTPDGQNNAATSSDDEPNTSIISNDKSQDLEDDEQGKTEMFGNRAVREIQREKRQTQSVRRKQKGNQRRSNVKNRKRNNNRRKSRRNNRKKSKAKKQRNRRPKKQQKSTRRRCKGRKRCGQRTDETDVSPDETEGQEPEPPVDPESVGPDAVGPETAGPEPVGPEPSGPEPVGPAGGDGGSNPNRPNPLISMTHLDIAWGRGADGNNKGHAKLWVS